MTNDGWLIKTIGDLCDFSSGYGFRPVDWAKEGLPIIRIQNLNGSQDFNYYNRQPRDEWLVEPGTLLFAWAGTRGVSFGPTIWHGPRGVLNQHIYRIHPRDGVNPLWLCSSLEIVTRNIERKAHGFKATLVHVRKDEITGQIVYVPPLQEQQRIVDILAKWDHAIEITTQLVAAKQERKRGLMQQLLTENRRFSAFAGRVWSRRRLGDLFVERRETHRSDLPLLSITNNEGVVPRESIDRRDTSNEDKSLYLRICPGDIGYNTMRMWQGVSAVSDLEGIVSPAYTICVPQADVDVHYMGYLFKFPPVIHLFKRHSQGLVDDTLSLKFDTFAKIDVSIPAIDEQRAMAQMLSKCDREINLLMQKLDLLKRQKQGVMQQLMAGKVRVPA